MKAIIFLAPEKVAVETVPDPAIIEPLDAIVRVRQTAICGSDLHIYHGRESGLDPGTVMGHEFAGEVAEIGRDVRNIHKGDRVGGPFSINCGYCYFCRLGLTARCAEGRVFFGWVQDGKGLQGTQAEFVRVPYADATLVKMPDGVTWDEAVLLGDNLAAGEFAANMAEVKKDGHYAVVGCGTVGLLSILAAKTRNPAEIYAIDPLPFRRELAREMGAFVVCPPEEADDCIDEWTYARGADAVIEAVGNLPAQELAMRIVRLGGILSVVGMHTAERFAFSPADAYEKNLTYKTGRCSARHYMDVLLPNIEKYRDKIPQLISHRMPLEQGVEAYELFAAKSEECTKIMLEPST